MHSGCNLCGLVQSKVAIMIDGPKASKQVDRIGALEVTVMAEKNQHCMLPTRALGTCILWSHKVWSEREVKNVQPHQCSTCCGCGMDGKGGVRLGGELLASGLQSGKELLGRQETCSLVWCCFLPGFANQSLCRCYFECY
jgi:hypothetical protein